MSDKMKADEEIKKLRAMLAQMKGTVMEGTSTYWRLQSRLAELCGSER